MKKKILIYIGIFAIVGFVLYLVVDNDTQKHNNQHQENLVNARQGFESSLDGMAVRKGIIYHEDIEALSKKEVNLFVSFSNKKKVGAVPKEAEVFITNEDILNNYCEVTYYPSGPDSSITGWLSCDWIIEL